MIIKQLIEKINQFRETIHQSFEYRADALMDLLDAISSNITASSVVELSLNPLFRRNYSSVEKAITELTASGTNDDEKQQLLKLEKAHVEIITAHLPELKQRKFHLLATDVTPQPRPFAETLSDRKVVHAPNPTLSNKPIAIGHEYSHMVYLPEKAAQHQQSPPWVMPLSVRRVSSKETGISVAANQLEALMKNPKLPFASELCLHVGDGAYSAIEYLKQASQYENLVSIARLRSNRSLYFLPQQPSLNAKDAKGHPIWYGKPFKLKNANYYQADQEIETSYLSRSGRTFKLRIKAWRNLLLRGKKDCPMQECPLTLVRVQTYKSNGKTLYPRPLSLIVAGQRRDEISLADISAAYSQRYDIEHYFRFSKQSLLMSSYQTPDSQHEENWWHLTLLAYCQLFLAAPLAIHLPRPWESKKPSSSSSSSLLSPSIVQRDFARIIRQIGSPAITPKLRGYSKGRIIGLALPLRISLPIIFKSKKENITTDSLS